MAKAKSRFLLFILGIILIFTGCGGELAEKASYNNTVTAVDVGQAACTLIESEGQFALIDAGDAGGSTNYYRLSSQPWCGKNRPYGTVSFSLRPYLRGFGCYQKF